jgi:hypothetical protein
MRADLNWPIPLIDDDDLYGGATNIDLNLTILADYLAGPHGALLS